jgi:hypothetical protein
MLQPCRLKPTVQKINSKKYRMKTIFSKYKTLAFATLTGAMLTSCALDTVPTPTYAELMIVNAVPAASSSTRLVAGTAPRLEVNVDGVDLMADSLQSSNFRGYFPLTAGTKTVKLTAANAHPAAGITLGQEFHSFTFNGVSNGFTSAFVYTETTPAGAVINSLITTDDLTTPADGKVHVRVVNLTGADIDLFTTTTGTEGTAVITSTPMAVVTGVKSKSASAFTPLDAVPLRAGSALPTFVRKNYSFQVRAAGATTNLATLVTSTNNTNANTATLENQRIYTIVVRPGATATAAPTVFGLFNNRR